MAKMTHYKNRKYLRSTAVREFVLVPVPQTYIAAFTDYIHDITSSESTVFNG
jgi:hypothetical protein